MKPIAPFVLLSLLAGLTGCATVLAPTPVPGDPAFAPVAPQALVAPDEVNGAIFQDNGRGLTLFGDRTAFNVGDILEVILQEETQSSKSSETTFTKEQEIDINNGTLLGRATAGLFTDLEVEREFTGEAESDLSNTLTGSISVTVVGVLPNGVLRIRGEKWLTLNQGDEYIRLQGLVRPQDIRIDNTVLSGKIADARIAYSATGDFSDNNQPGIGARIFNSKWFPF